MATDFTFAKNGAEAPEGSWLLGDSPGEGRILPWREFCACFAPGVSLPDAAGAGEGADLLAGLDWNALPAEDWGRLQALLAGIDGGSWAAFAAEPSRLTELVSWPLLAWFSFRLIA